MKPRPPTASLLQIFAQSIHSRRMLASALVFVMVMTVGTAGYMIVGGPDTPVIDAIYMTFITVSTIGYGEVVDLTGHPWGRIFTIVIAMLGIANLTYMFSTVTAFILETNLDHAFRRRRMQTRIDGLSGHYIVCGAGRVGSYVIDELRGDRRAFVVIEAAPDAIERHREADPQLLIVEGDAGEDEVLERAGIARARGVFAVTGDDSKNLVVSLSAKQLNPKIRVVARIHDARNAAKTLRAGADEIVSPDFTGGHRIASLMIRPQMVSLVDELLRTGGRLAVEEVTVPSRPYPLTVGALGRSAEWLLVAVRNGSNWRFNPTDDQQVGTGEALVVIASAEGKRELQQRVAT